MQSLSKDCFWIGWFFETIIINFSSHLTLCYFFRFFFATHETSRGVICVVRMLEIIMQRNSSYNDFLHFSMISFWNTFQWKTKIPRLFSMSYR